ncbi:MAG: MarR family transcriptional regulator [Kiloniellales bacterium]|nr:MarR family transcriptional regulator [Kiloniellales bacterium]
MSEAKTLVSSDPSSDDKGRLRLWLRLLACGQAIEKVIRSRLRDEHGTTLPRFDVMAALDRHPEGLTMGEISRRLRVSNGNVTGVVDRLVREELLRRWHPEGNRRTFLIALTRKGRANFKRMAAQHQAWIDDMLAGLDDAEIKRLAALMERVQSSVSQAAEREGNSHADG